MGNNMSVVAHNLQGMFSDRQLGIVTGRKEKSIEKLSSGYRINRAADDAAGLAISEKMRRQIRGLTQGTANAQDGVSMCQIADGALNEVSDMLHRITELSVKSANGTNTAQDRQAIQQEVNAILSEIDRVCDTTKFNEQPIFQGAEGVTIIPATYAPTTVGSFTASGTPMGTQAGTYRIAANTGGFSINGESYGWSDFADGAGHTLADSSVNTGTYSFTHNGITMSLEVQDNASMDDVVGKLNGAGYSTKIDSSESKKLLDENVLRIWGGGTNIVSPLGDTAWSDYKKYNTTVKTVAEDDNLVIYTGRKGYYNGAVEDIVYKCDLIESLGITDINDSIIPGKDYTLTFHAGDNPESNGNNRTISDDFSASIRVFEDGITGSDIAYIYGMGVTYSTKVERYIWDSGSWHWDSNAGFPGTYGYTYDSLINLGFQDKFIETNVILEIDKVFSPDYKGRVITPEERISAEEDKRVWIQSGAEAGDGIYLTFGRMDTNILGIHGLDVSTEAGATDSIERSKEAVTKLNGIRSNIGAQQNRLEHTIKHQENTIENIQHAESLIRDTDMATEMMSLSAANIIQQAGQSMLVQANQSNQGVLSLLQ